MTYIRRIGTWFFIIGVLIAIFSGTFPFWANMQTLALLMLIITGAFVGLLNIEKEQQVQFLLATGVLILGTKALDEYLINLELLSNFETILTNMIIFSSSAALVVAMKIIFSHASVNKHEEELEFSDEKKEAKWDFVIFVAVCLTFIIFILEAFFDTSGFTIILEVLNYIIIIVFFIDAILLYRISKTALDFWKYHWLDVLAIIPFSGVFQLAKLARLVRIARVASRSSKIARLSKITHSAKFFSHERGITNFLKEEDKKE